MLGVNGQTTTAATFNFSTDTFSGNSFNTILNNLVDDLNAEYDGTPFSYSMDQANRASELMETGTVAVNTHQVPLAEAPFGGIKQTGYGREGGSMAIKDYLNVKYTHLGIKG